MRTRLVYEALVVLALLVLPFLFFWSVTFGGRTLIPFDNLYLFEPWKSYASQFQVGVPHNQLLSDLVLENYAWKGFLLDTLRSKELPLWNPYIFAGIPFLAAGQHSALYPLNVIYYLIPLRAAYGFFSALHFFLAALFMYLYLRLLGTSRFGALIAGITYAYSLFMVVSVVFPMVIAAATWLPLILTMVEASLAARENARSPVPYLLLGSAVIGVQFLAGHIEISLDILLVTALYGFARLALLWRKKRDTKTTLGMGLALLSMMALGMGLAGAQLVPLLELVRLNFRQATGSLAEIINYAFPLRQIVSFFVPNFFGNPAHHSYFDIISHQILPAMRDFSGAPIDTIFWGIKNYVEAGSYVGMLPLLLALVAIIGRRCRYSWFFAGLAILSLLLVFGSPLYALFFYLIPGYRQLHTPFRWVFPYTLSMAVLAGLGADWLTRGRRPVRGLAIASLGVGLTLLLIAAIIFAYPVRFVGLAERFLAASQRAQQAFASGQVLLSYEWPNLLHLAIFTSLSSLAVLLAVRSRLGKALAITTLIFDLFLISYGFNPAADPRLGEFTPPAIAFLQNDPDLFRITTFISSGEKTLNANTPMLYRLQDIRGYDSIILRRYVEFMGLIEPQDEILYNRIAPFSDYESLDSPLLDLLNVKYVVTSQHIPNPGYTLVYEGEVRIYRNDDYLPRAFVLPDTAVEVIPNEGSLLKRLEGVDPRQVLLLEEAPQESYLAASPAGPATAMQVSISRYSSLEVVAQVDMANPGWLVLADSYFPGWRAYLTRTDGAEQEIHLYQADYNFRAVHLPAGSHAVRFKYSPFSFKLGLFLSFLAATMLITGFGYFLWGFLFRKEAQGTIQRVVKNSLTPMGTSFFNKAIDAVFAMIMLRILGPEGQGKYGFAIIIVGYLEIVTNFGLNTLMTREVAKDPSQGNRYLSNTAILRLLILAGLMPIIVLFVIAWRSAFALPSDTIIAIALLILSLIPSNIASALSSLFIAHEKMEYPAALSTVSTILRVTLGLIALLLGFGFVGLAAVSVLVNIITTSILLYLVTKTFFLPRPEFDPAFNREMLGTSYPLMINNLLATLFFRVDVPLLQPMKGDTVVGWYTTAYKFIDAVNIIPSAFTIAIFPIMSRYAHSARESLIKAYTLSIKALFIVSLPLALLISFYSQGIILIFAGSAFLPHAATALAILVWYAPVGFINSVTQYVLIAINQQKFLIRAFLIGVAFNFLANLIFIPLYSYKAAAAITILSEIALLFPFYYGVRKHLTSVPWLRLTWRPIVAALAMAATLWLLRGLNFILVVPASLVLYAALLIALGAFEAEEIALIKTILPGRRQGEEFHTAS